jgi:hypothetical protein
MKEGIAAIDSAVKELEEKKYLLRVQYCCPKTKQKRGSTWAATSHPFHFNWQKIFIEIQKRGMEIWSGSLQKIKLMIDEKPDIENLDIAFRDIENSPLTILKNNKIKNNQIKTTSSSLSDSKVSGDSFPETKQKLPVSPERIMSLWNRMAATTAELKPISRITPARRKHITARLQLLPTIRDWRNLFSKVEENDFLKGKGNRSWVCSLDWLIKNEDNPIKVIEGSFDWGVKYSAEPKIRSRTSPGNGTKVKPKKYAGTETEEVETDKDGNLIYSKTGLPFSL